MSQVERRLSLDLRVSRFKTPDDSIAPSTSVAATVVLAFCCCRFGFLAEASRYEYHLCRSGC